MSSHVSTIMGKVTSVYGVKGWVKVFSYTQPKGNLGKYSVWTLEKGGHKKQVKVLSCKVHGNGLIAQLEGCADREQAKALTDSMICVDKAELPELEEGEFYWHQLESLSVRTVDGLLLGKVHHLMETGSNDVLVVRKCSGSIDGKERLIPYLPDQVVKSIDLGAGIIEVEWDPEF
jgi:16S rRNA processing protein RimM